MGYYRGYSDGLEESWYECAEARRQLAEAAEAVRLLLEYVRADRHDAMLPSMHDGTGTAECKPCRLYRALPAWMRKEIER